MQPGTTQKGVVLYSHSSWKLRKVATKAVKRNYFSLIVIFLNEGNHQETLVAAICDGKDKKNRTAADLKGECISVRRVVVLGKFQTFIK